MNYSALASEVLDYVKSHGGSNMYLIDALAHVAVKYSLRDDQIVILQNSVLAR